MGRVRVEGARFGAGGRVRVEGEGLRGKGLRCAKGTFLGIACMYLNALTLAFALPPFLSILSLSVVFISFILSIPLCILRRTILHYYFSSSTKKKYCPYFLFYLIRFLSVFRFLRSFPAFYVSTYIPFFLHYMVIQRRHFFPSFPLSQRSRH